MWKEQGHKFYKIVFLLFITATFLYGCGGADTPFIMTAPTTPQVNPRTTPDNSPHPNLSGCTVNFTSELLYSVFYNQAASLTD